jgi:hypothetical protein
MSGTLLSDLDSSPSNDDNAVQRILNEMNGKSMAPPPMPQQQMQAPQLQTRQQQAPVQVINSPNPNSTIQHSMDNMPPTAHMIGMDHPTNADFAAMMNNQRPMAQQQQQYGSPNQWNMYNQQQQQQYQQQMPNYYGYNKSWTNDIIKEIKIPVFVALLFFFFSLPIVNVMVSHYFPYLVKGTGELTSTGLFIKSILAGCSFWILHRIVAPLLTSS